MAGNMYTRIVSPKLGYVVNLTGHNTKGKLKDSCLVSIVSSKKEFSSIALAMWNFNGYVVHVVLPFVTEVTNLKGRHSNDERKSSSYQ